MSIKITWADTAAAKYEIYESTESSNVYIPGNLISTVIGATEYTKTNEVAGVFYYYGIRAVYSTGVVDCPVFQVYRPADTGPGTGGLVRGNHKRGVFPIISGADAASMLPAISDLHTPLFAIITPALAAKITASTGQVIWNKIIHDGKILFSPKSRCIVTSIANITLAEQTEITNALATLKDAIIEHNGRRYKHKHGIYDMLRMYGFGYQPTRVAQAPQETQEFPRYTGSENAAASGITNFVASDKTYNFNGTSGVGAEGTLVGGIRYFTYLELISE